MTAMSNYAADQLCEMLRLGPHEGEDFYRLQVMGNGSTNWVNITEDQLGAIADLLDVA